MLLSFSAGVFCFALLVEAALIDNTEGTVVVMAGMNALDGLWQQGDDTAVVADIVVVGALAILGLAAGNEVLNAEGLGDRGDRSVSRGGIRGQTELLGAALGMSYGSYNMLPPNNKIRMNPLCSGKKLI